MPEENIFAKLISNLIKPGKKEEKKKSPQEILGKPSATQKLILESTGAGVESHYYWFIRQLENLPPYGFGCKVEKLKDIYGAAETSSYFGMVEQRKAIQEDRVSSFMATIGKLVKDSFQMIRELRILDERLKFYDDAKKEDESAEITLKGTWIDMVEGGMKNPASVYGLATQVGFVTLPDLFYKVNPKTSDDVDKEMKKLEKEGINRKIREILGRKLKQYMVWKEQTEKELRTRKNFVLKYLRHHFNTVKMYIDWLRPYLQNLKMLRMKRDVSDKEIVSAFETSRIQLEILGKQTKYEVQKYDEYMEEMKYKKKFPCVLVKFSHTAMPQMAFYQEQQRGAIHIGRTEILIEGYVLTEKQIEDYKKALESEDFELIASVNDAMEALKEELFKYLDEAGEAIKKEEAKKEKEGFFTPLTSAFKGFGEIFKSFSGKKEKGSKDEGEIAKDTVKKVTYLIYNIFKKTHGMLNV